MNETRKQITAKIIRTSGDVEDCRIADLKDLRMETGGASVSHYAITSKVAMIEDSDAGFYCKKRNETAERLIRSMCGLSRLVLGDVVIVGSKLLGDGSLEMVDISITAASEIDMLANTKKEEANEQN